MPGFGSSFSLGLFSEGGSAATGVGAGASLQISQNGIHSTGGARVEGLIASTQTFRVDILITPDAGVTWVIAKSINSVAGSDATYNKVAEIDQYLPSFVQILVTNTSGSSANFVSDIRFFQVGAR